MEVSCDGGDERLMFIWPTIVVHKIDKNSPLYNLSAQDMLRERFEIVVMLGMVLMILCSLCLLVNSSIGVSEGVVESTGMTTQARSSYLPSEVLWGHRFESVVSFKRETGEYEVSPLMASFDEWAVVANGCFLESMRRPSACLLCSLPLIMLSSTSISIQRISHGAMMTHFPPNRLL